MDAYVPAARLRQQDEEFETELSQINPDSDGGSPAVAAQTTTETTYPTVANAFYQCQTLSVLGAEIEGGAASITTDPGTIKAYNFGSQVPPVGTKVICRFVSSRWVFRYP